MKSISDPFLRRPVLTLVLSLLVLLGGLISLPGLKVENLPPIAPGRVSVSASYPGASPEVVEQGVTTLLEKQFNGLERLDSIRSTSSANGSSISLGFEGGNPEINQINTQNEAAVVSRQLPAQVARFGVQVRRTSDDLLMTLSFSASRDRYDATFLSGWVDQVIRDRLQRVPGVGEVRLFGGSSLAFRLWLDPLRLEERNLTISEVRDALEEQNVLAALGQAGVAPSPDDQLVTLPLRMEGRLRTAQEFESLVVDRSANGGVTLLKDVGRVSLGSENYESIATDLSGKTAVAVGIFQRDGSNALEVSQGIDQALEELGPRFPPGVDLQVIVDEAASIRTSIDRTTASLREAVLLVFLVLLLGLGNSRLALISASAVPVALIGSLAVLRLSGDSINTLTLFGMVLASGLVVDDAIVVSEDIGRRLENGRPPGRRPRSHGGTGRCRDRHLPGADRGVPAGADPGGQPGPSLRPDRPHDRWHDRLLHLQRPHLHPGGRQPAAPRRSPGARLAAALDRSAPAGPRASGGPLRPAAQPCAGLAASRGGRPADRSAADGPGVRAAAQGLHPPGGQRPAAGVLLLQDGIALPRTQQVMEQVREVMDQEPLIRFANFYAGRSFGDSSPNKGIFFLRLKPIEERPGADQSAAAVAERLNRRLRQTITDATVIVSESPTVRGFSSESGLEFDLLDTSGGRLSLGEFQQEAEAFIAAARQTGAFDQVGTRFSADAPLLRLIPDRLRMASLQVDLDELVSVLGASFGSDYVNDSFEGDQVRKVIVQLEGEARRDADDVLALQVRNRTGQLIPWPRSCRWKPAPAPPPSTTPAWCARSASGPSRPRG